MALENEMTPAEQKFFSSKGQDAGDVLAENNRLDVSTSKDRTSGREHDFSSFTPAECTFLETGDIEPARQEERARSPQARQEADQQQRRQTWREYKNAYDYAVETEHENRQLIDANARLSERQQLIEQALTPEPTPQERAAMEQEWARRNIRPQTGANPIGAIEYDRAELQRIKQYLAQQASAQSYERGIAHYRDEALRYESEHPGYVREIYQPFQASLRRDIAHQNPRWNANRIEHEARLQEAGMVDAIREQGRNPHETIHFFARQRGIASTAERQHHQRQLERAQVEHARRQEAARRAAEKRASDALDGCDSQMM
jgi:hypothetical protein